MPPCQLPIFETLLQKRGRTWRWSVCTAEGEVVMLGAERRRTAARYRANRALFQMLLCAPYAHADLCAGDSEAWNLTYRSHSSILPE
jgi:hypothetical protein